MIDFLKTVAKITAAALVADSMLTNQQKILDELRKNNEESAKEDGRTLTPLELQEQKALARLALRIFANSNNPEIAERIANTRERWEEIKERCRSLGNPFNPVHYMPRNLRGDIVGTDKTFDLAFRRIERKLDKYEKTIRLDQRWRRRRER